jgi:beta-galactosidase
VGYFPTGIGWYRKTFNFPGYSKNHMYSIEFDGVYMNSEVWINGFYLGKRPYGYSSFSYDLTPYLKASGNVITVRVDNSAQPNLRWYTGSGIYRHVRIVRTNPFHFEKWGVFSYTGNIKNENAQIHVESTILNEKGPGVKAAVIRNELFNADGVSVGKSESSVVINANAKAKTKQKIYVENTI